LVTCISSKQSNFASAAISSATGSIGSPSSRAGLAQAGVGLEHELVEVDAPLGRDCDMLERQVHQHGFAAPDAAPQVNARGPIALRAEQARKETAGIGDASGQAVERRNRALLCRIRLQLMCGNQLLVSRADRRRHLVGALGRFTRFSVPLNV
jgi:hypothetical protein